MKFALVLVLFACIGFSSQAAHKRVANKSDEICEVCEVVAQQLKDVADADLPDEVVKEYVEDICEILQGEREHLCNDKILPLFHEIYEKVHSETPEKVCGDLGFCSDEM